MLQDRFAQNPLSAIANVAFQMGKHALMGDLSISAKVYDHRSKDLKKCENCNACFLVCPVCDHLIPVDMSTLVMDKTTVQCPACR